MALITRCPVCGTRFKVVPDQLRISDGWVRCGECAEVFDAAMELTQSEAEPLLAPAPGDANLFAEPPPLDHLAPPPLADGWAPLPRHPQNPPTIGTHADSGTGYGIGTGTGYVWSAPPMPEAAPQQRFETSFQPAFDKPSMTPADPPVQVDEHFMPGIDDGPPADDTSPALAPWDPVFDDPASEMADEPERAKPETQDDGRDEVPQSLTEFPADMSTLPEDSGYIAPPAAAELDAALDDARAVSFLRSPPDEPEVGLWQRPGARRGLMALAGVLVLALGVQAAVQQRDQIAARLPGATPLLRGLCAPLGCTVQALRQIDAIVIDSSTFATVRHGVYRLNLVLKNRAATEIAVPAIELALTDTQEQPVLRRVLQAVDMAAAQGNIGPNGEWTATMELAVADEPSISRIVGYRLLAFYP